MGADMLLVYVEIPKDFDLARKRIEKLSGDRLYEIADICWGWDKKEIESIGHVEAAQQVRDAIHEALGLLETYRRDISYMTLKGTEYALTGGMSWGDYPTDAFPQLELLAEADVTYSTNAIGERIE